MLILVELLVIVELVEEFMSMATILIIAVVVVALWSIMIYNKLIHLIEATNNNKNQIDVQLDRRYKVYESLIEVVKKYMDYEKTTLKEVVALRANAQKALASGDQSGRISAEEAISRIGANLNLVFEQYPDLKADKNALQLQEEIVSTENKLAFAKQSYNDSVEQYKAKSKSLFESFLVGVFPEKLMKEFPYWGISDEQRQVQENYKVKI
jgi:LemA protein